MRAIEEYNGVETFYHGITQYCFNQLVEEASGKIEDIVLYGRVFNSEMDILEAERDGDYEEEKGIGYVYACDCENRDNATPGASAHEGVRLILGYDGVSEIDPIYKRGEVLVPLEAYKVIGVEEE